ncbi:hypothetical protein N752_18830 [Desulforamulus aquiferis]|nr:arginine deiminase family protein [Desulforamulus aquiferis]RYD03630.1 hypothetical protein N752_18830 [Desulforamulus aquiferis]
MFTQAIVRKPSTNFAAGITKAGLGKPDYHQALEQHAQYVAALERCGLKVRVLEADERYPDSTFVEDTAIVTEKCAVITRLGAESRQGEELIIGDTLGNCYSEIEAIVGDGLLDGGDVMRVENHFYIGLSHRTNEAGAKQLINILNKYHYTGSAVSFNNFLHLKTGITYLDQKNFVAAGDLANHPIFKDYNIIKTPPAENYSANCILINDFVLVAKGFPQTLAAIQARGYTTIELDMSEFQKMDGGLTCLSLRF